MGNLIIKKRKNAKARQHRVRFKISGTAKRPRVAVFRSLKHIQAQLIDDENGKTLVSASDNDIKGKNNRTEVAKQVGAVLAKKAGEKKIKEVVFDRRAYKYHGRVKALADALREGGVRF